MFLVTQTQDKGNDQTQSLIDANKKQAREKDHHNHERGGNQCLAPSRPSHLACFRAYILNELEWIRHEFGETLQEKGSWEA
jgi:hypothetical protein